MQNSRLLKIKLLIKSRDSAKFKITKLNLDRLQYVNISTSNNV